MEPAQNSWFLTPIKRGHRVLILQRRVRVLAEVLASQIPQRSTVLDIGCGDGAIASLIAQLRPDISIRGVEVMARSDCRIPCEPFDGSTLPYPNDAFDGSILVDVLHHTKNVASLLREAARVSRSFVLLKDHLNENFLDDATLRFMDWVGNRPHGVTLAYNYRSRQQWSEHFAECGLRESTWATKIPLYPAPFHFIVGRGLHFVSLLVKANHPTK